MVIPPMQPCLGGLLVQITLKRKHGGTAPVVEHEAAQESGSPGRVVRQRTGLSSSDEED